MQCRRLPQPIVEQLFSGRQQSINLARAGFMHDLKLAGHDPLFFQPLQHRVDRACAGAPTVGPRLKRIENGVARLRLHSQQAQNGVFEGRQFSTLFVSHINSIYCVSQYSSGVLGKCKWATCRSCIKMCLCVTAPNALNFPSSCQYAAEDRG